MNQPSFECEEKTLPAMKIAAVRMKSPYKECGKGFSKIGKAFWRQVNGPPMLLCHDTEYKEIADFEACMPIKDAADRDGIDVRELPGGRCVSLLHQGPYEELSKSYKKLSDYFREKGYQRVVPSREIYLKGPGMIFKGNPKKYLTEIQIMIES